MNDAGYTLAETLAALAVIGLSIGGLSLAAQVIAPLQLSTGKTVRLLESTRAAGVSLERLLARGAPFGSQQPGQLSGDANGFQFQCGGTAPCSAQIVASGTATQLKVANGSGAPAVIALSLTSPAHFQYRGSSAQSDTWPPTGPARQALRSVSLLQTTPQGDAAVLQAKVWPEEPAQCDFDPILQACR